MTLKQTAIGTLATRALLVDLDIHFWYTHKRDRVISDEVKQKHNTDGSYNKRLIPKKEMIELNQAFTEVGNIHRRYTLPWGDNGNRIIIGETLFVYREKMQKGIQRCNDAADNFASKYNDIVEGMKRVEKDSFKGKDYPSKEEMRGKFGVTIKYYPVPQGDDLRLTLSNQALSAVISEIGSSINQDQQSRIEGAVLDIAERIKDRVGKMVERLQAYKPRTKKGEKSEATFKDSLIDNVKELADLLPRVNITGDPKIEKMAEDLQKLLLNIKPWHLRSDEKLREKTANQADKILKRVSEFI